MIVARVFVAVKAEVGRWIGGFGAGCEKCQGDDEEQWNATACDEYQHFIIVSDRQDKGQGGFCRG